ncbi:substrate-binding domain-containing protein [Sinomicrobium weinanense]|uniref:Substrate-binding domain-containing protein n=1 Tax=Sinomicrobium weinanense TaxID=2842200 RepID=A0A926Q235_9FLAO|nr:substrate-binding domain-containing protein [Sinomicrobium weinanense]MBC9796118.1 substrate-binding domain-containing protein [Sinomicrobium weinanense]MBU3124787.1 substrate-binding domain-containing protein [Sinomicrobium weinanense]
MLIYRKPDIVRFSFMLASLMLTGLLFSCTGLRKEKDKIKIGFSQGMTTDDWRKQMNKSMRLEASLHDDVDLAILDADDDVEKQLTDIETLIRNRSDIIIVSPIQSRPLTAVVEKSVKAGIPVIVIDRKIENERYTAYIGADNIEVGRNAGRYIASVIPHHEGGIRIVEIKGLKGSSPAYERSLGFRQIVNRFEKLKVVASIDGNWESESVKAPLRNILKQDKDIDYVFCHNDRMALSAWEVAREKGVENKIKFIGVDGLNTRNGGIQLVQDKVLQATIFYPTGGNEAIKLALKILNKDPVSKNNILGTTVIDSVNADIMKNQLDKIDLQQASIENQLHKLSEQEKKYATQTNLIKILTFSLVLILSLALYSIYSTYVISKKKKLLELQSEKITLQQNEIEKITGQEFRTRLDTIIEQHLDNPQFTVEELAQRLNLSRVQLYRKIKGMFGISVNEYISGIRLEKSREMLRKTSLNIAEVAYACGFSSPNYFSTSFKNKYGITPKEYKNNP